MLAVTGDRGPGREWLDGCATLVALAVAAVLLWLLVASAVWAAVSLAL